MEYLLGLGLVITTTILLVANDWRFNIGGFAGQCVFLAGIIAFETIPTMAMIKIVVGILAASLFYTSARNFDLTSRPFSSVHEQDGSSSARATYRYVAVGLSLAIALGMANGYPFKDLEFVTTFACYWLASSGILTLIVTRDTLRVGYSLLTIASAIDVLCSTIVDTSGLVAYSLSNIFGVIIAFTVLYLASLQHEVSEAGQKERQV